MIRNMVWDVVKADLDKLAVTTDSLREEQVEYCRRNNLTLTPQFKQQLLGLLYVVFLIICIVMEFTIKEGHQQCF